jgi:type VI secretion system ImpM family protein
MDYLPVGCYGKVPSWREYIEHEIRYAVSRDLRRWLRDGFEGARLTEDGGESGFEEGAGRRFLVAPADSSEWLAGVVGPSEDSAGREKLFAVFAHLPRRRFAKAFHLLPAALVPIWRALEDTREQLIETLSKEAFDEAIRSSRVTIPEDPATLRSDYERHLAGPAAALFRDGLAGPDALASGLPETIARIKESKKTPVAVRLPVSAEVQDAAADVGFWIDLVNRQFLWKEFQPSVFLSRQAGADPDVVLVYGNLEVDLYPDLLGAEPGDRVLRPCGLPAAAPPPGDPDGTTYEALLKRKY